MTKNNNNKATLITAPSRLIHRWLIRSGGRPAGIGAILLWTLLISPPLAMAQGEIFGGGSAPPSEEEADPMAADMTKDAISARLQESRAGIAKASDQTIRSQWEQTTEILQLQLELLTALEEDYPTEALEHPEGTPPFPLAYLDQIRHKYRYFNTVHKQLDKGHEAAQNRIKAAGETYTSARQQLSTIEEEGGTAEQNELADIEYRLAMESYIYARLDARVLNLKLAQSYQNLERFGSAIPEIEQDVYLSEQDFSRQMEDISEREQMLTESLRATRRDLMSEMRKPKDTRVHQSALDSLQNLLREALSYLHYEHTVWDERKKLYLDEATEEEIVAWHEENTLKRSEIIELLQVKELAQQRHAKVLVQQEQQDSLISTPVDVELQKDLLLRRQLAFDNLGRIIELLQDHLADLERVRKIDKLKFLKAKVRHTADSIWNMQLAVIQDRTITVGKAVSAIALFMIGFVIARFLILKSLYFLLRKIKVREAVAYTVSQLLFYLLLLVLLFGVISYVGIPLRIFAFFGGALAIAAGFGSQKIISNFLSGIVLLLEGSIRVGDTVQVDDSKGRVKSIGLRHIQMTTFNNVDILIPNAKFLEENVINWTLESQTIRSDFALGVDFTAPLEVVQDILVQVALGHAGVMDTPPPEAFLEHINNDAGYLRFNLYYWHTMQSPRERLLINSALQTEIIQRLRAKGIELASPTQDIITHTGVPAV